MVIVFNNKKRLRDWHRQLIKNKESSNVVNLLSNVRRSINWWLMESSGYTSSVLTYFYRFLKLLFKKVSNEKLAHKSLLLEL